MQLSGVCVNASQATDRASLFPQSDTSDCRPATNKAHAEGEHTAMFQYVAPCGCARWGKEVPECLKYQVSSSICKECFFGQE